MLTEDRRGLVNILVNVKVNGMRGALDDELNDVDKRSSRG